MFAGNVYLFKIVCTFRKNKKIDPTTLFRCKKTVNNAFVETKPCKSKWCLIKNLAYSEKRKLWKTVVTATNLMSQQG